MQAMLLNERAEVVMRVYTTEALAELQANAGLETTTVYSMDDVRANPAQFASVELIFSTWGMPKITQEEVAQYFPKLKCVFYGAGSVQHFARPFLHNGVRVFSAWGANAIPVAEFTAAQIVLAMKGYFPLERLMRSRHDAQPSPDYVTALREGDAPKAYVTKGNFYGNYEECVGLIGAGMIGRHVIKLLKNYELKVKVYDPYLPEERAQALGVSKCSLEELFATCQVVSNHLPNKPETEKMITGAHFASMRPYAAFINTARGAQVDEPAMVEALRARPDLTALLDVTAECEPSVEGNPIYDLPNCYRTPHAAGSFGNEVRRMGKYMVEEFERWRAGEECLYEVTEKMLETMA